VLHQLPPDVTWGSAWTVPPLDVVLGSAGLLDVAMAAASELDAVVAAAASACSDAAWSVPQLLLYHVMTC